MDTINFEEISQLVKQKMKSQGLTYRELAGRLQMSESGVKKIFAAKDISVLRLNSICQAIGIRFSDLIHSIESRDVVEVSFTQEQENFFVKNMEYFYFYWKLVYERKAVEEIAEEFSLSLKTINGYLKKLNSLGLVRFTSTGVLRIPPVQSVYWVGKGPLVEKIYQNFSQQMMVELAHPNLSSDESFILRYYKVRPSTFNDLKAALKKLEEEFLARTVREMRMNSRGLKDVRWISALDTKSFVRKLTGD
ncbi:MAG: hypothetical protein A4S09_11005 [Proteobacteria bacterium SG_bin7]|nr:MAG: hypothetical protein A4S09_11005 [Proteobacteria bacterium SG_bin7]